MIATLFPASAVAQSQNEVLVNTVFDGTAPFDAGEPGAPSGTAPEFHTPSLDGGPNNGVVRTHDQFAVRIDWNVNEDAANNVVLTAVLPLEAEWSPDATGMFAGCDPALSSFPNPQTLECHVPGAQPQGSNGVIRPVATLNEALDNSLLNVDVTMTTADDPAGVNDALDQPLTVSEGPYANYRKDAPTTSAVVNNGAEDGYVLLFPLSFFDFSQGAPITGVGPINDAVPVDLFDHMWNLTPSARIATPAEMGLAGFGGSPCGNYDAANGGPYVDGANPATGTWTCGPTVVGAGGYPVVPITLSGFMSRPPVATLIDGSPNGPVGSAPVQVSSGQIAVWLPKSEVDAAIVDPNNPDPTDPSSNTRAEFDNSLAGQNETSVISGAGEVNDGEGNGTSGSTSKGDPADNTASARFGAEPGGGGPGGGRAELQQNVWWDPGPLQFFSSTRYDPTNANPGYHTDIRQSSVGGHGRLPGTTDLHGLGDGTDFIGAVARGQVLTLRGEVYAIGDGDIDAPLQGCIAFDTSHYELVALPSSIPVAELGDATDFGNVTPAIGLTSLPANAGPLAHVLFGTTRDFPAVGGYGKANVTPAPSVPFIVEFSSTPTPRIGGAFGAAADALTCNDSDGTWVDSTDTAGLAQFDANGDGRYEGITRARYRTLTPANWGETAQLGADDVDGSLNQWIGLKAHFNVQVKQDLSVNSDGQELWAANSHAYGELGPDGVPNLERFAGDPAGASRECRLFGASDWIAISGNDVFTTTGWCNQPFADDGVDSFDTADAIDWPQQSGVFVSAVRLTASSTVLQIVGAKLGIAKENLDGPGDIKDNGQLVQFKITPTVTGAEVEALTNVRVVDNLPPHFEFVRFVDLPDAPHDCNVAGQVVSCRFSDPTAPYGGHPLLPAGIPGGWEGQDASFIIEVIVTGAIADPDSPTVLGNVANGRSEGLGPWNADDGSFTDTPSPGGQNVSAYAQTVMPLPADEGAIIKALETFEGDCTTYPAGPIDAPVLDPQPADWADRCEMIDFDSAFDAATGADMSFTLSLTNEGNTAFTNVRMVDVFPHNGDEVEPASNTPTDEWIGSTPTMGDGRSPETDMAGTIEYVSQTLVGPAAGTFQVLVTGDPAGLVSRDPDAAWATTTWCDSVGGVVQNPASVGSGVCPASPADVTATYSIWESADGVGLRPGQTLTQLVSFESVGAECDDIWTNTFGARVDQIFLPIRSNDVSIMVNCEFDLALRKVVDPAWTPGADWLTAGSSPVDFVIEVHNQGNSVNNFDVTDYVDPAMFVFDPALNAAGNTLDGAALPFTWDSTGANPVVTVNDPAHPLHDPNSNLIQNGDVILIPVTLTVASGFSGTDLDNYAEISRFDNDADPTNEVPTDDDSLPDGSNGDALVDDELNSDINQGGPDEDDHDVAHVPLYDLAIDKINPTISQVGADWIATFDVVLSNEGNRPALNVSILETPPPGLTFQSSNAASVVATDVLGSAVTVSDTDPTYTVSRIEPGDAVTFTITYVVTDLTAGPYTNSVQVADFEDEAGNNPPDVDSDPGNDDDHSADSGDANEDDDAVETVSLPFDLALVKRPVTGDPAFPDIMNGVQNGDEILFHIEVFNQLATVEDFDVIDYLQPGWIFDPAAQVSPLFTVPGSGPLGGPALPFSWTSSGADPIAVVDGVLPAGESVIIPIVLTADIPNDPAAVLENFAEILRFDDDGDPDNGDSSDGTISDIDSTPDGTNDDMLIDDEVNDDGTVDEDDHDVASAVWYDVALEKGIVDGAACVDGPDAITASTATVEFCIIVRNQGPTALFNIDFADTAPAGLVWSSTTLASANVTDNGGGAYTIAQLDPGFSERIHIEYTVDVAAMTGGSLVNVAEVSDMEGPAGNSVADVDSFADDTPDSDAPVEDDEDDAELTIPFDLALTKTLGEINGDQVTMLITVTNQSLPVQQIEITDYIDPAMFEPFDPALNPGGTTTLPGSVFDFSFFWDATDPQNPVASLTPANAGDMISFGDTVTVPITLTIADGWVGPDLENTAEISNFDNDNDPNNGDGADGTLADVDSTPDGIDGNGAGESVNQVDDETGEDGLNGGDEDDHDSVAIPVFDLALRKTLDPATVQPVGPGDEVTFLIEIINQGNTHATDVNVIDYVDQTMFGPFTPALGANAGGATTGHQALAYTWTPSGTDGAVTVTGSIAPGNTVIVPVTLRVSFTPTATTLNNTAEITNGTATDAGGAEVTDGAGNSLSDIDSSPDADNDDTLVDDETGNAGGDEDDHDIAAVIVAVPAIEIEKDTNGVQSDSAPGEQIMAGDPVVWSYVVTNTGTTALLDATVTDSDPGVTVDCDPSSQVTNVIPMLLPGESITCEASGTATLGAYSNTSDVSGTPAFPTDPSVDPNDPASWPTDPDDFTPTGQDDVTDSDDSHYYGTDGGLVLEKATNGIDADTAPGVPLSVGDAVVWTYAVTNTSPVAILDATVTDSDIGAAIDCGAGTNVIAILMPGETVTCTSIDPVSAVAGQYHNDSDVTGDGALPTDPAAPGVDLDDPTTWPTDPAGYDETAAPPFTDEDPSNYFALEGGLELEKDTNGLDSDVAPGGQIAAGDAVTWTYAVTNNSNAVMINVLVEDSDTTITVDCGDGSDRIPVLAIGETVACTATGTAELGQYANDSDVVGQPAIEDPENPGGPSDDPGSYVPTGHESTDEDPSHYFGADRAIDIEKDTNGDDADTEVGPILDEGDVVTWTYVVTNTGNVPLVDVVVTDSEGETVVCPSGDNTIALLLPGASVTCEALGIAVLGQYENIADVSGTPAELDDPDADPDDPVNYQPSGLDPVVDDDPSHYIAHDGEVVIVKTTNDQDANTAPGAHINIGDPVVWKYTVANTADTPLVDLVVTDDQGEEVDCGDGSNSIDVLLPGETHICTATGIAGEGQYTNVGDVTGLPGQPNGEGGFEPIPGVDPVTDDDPSNYLGHTPAIDIEKATNGFDADDTVGPVLAPGDAVTWSYEVTNTGDLPLTDVVVTDSQGETVICAGSGENTIALLLPGQEVECVATGVAELGAYENIADVSGTPSYPTAPAAGCCDPADPASWPTDPADFTPTGQDDVIDDDPSHYIAHDGDVLIEKATNGEDADVVPGPIVNPGGDVTWTYAVTNTSDTMLIDLIVTDDQGEVVDCGNGTNRIAELAPGATHYCTATGTAVPGQYANIGSVTGTPAMPNPVGGGWTPIPGADPATDDDPSHYLGAVPAIDIEKATNGVDADTETGPLLAPGDAVTWTYVVTNTGDVPLVDAFVTDSQGETVVCPSGNDRIALLLPGESVTCSASGIAVLGQYMNDSDVIATPAQPTSPTVGCCDLDDPASWPTDPNEYELTGQDDVVDDDPSHYVAHDASIDIEKATNGEDADVVPGPVVNPGGDVTWTYAVTNTSATVLIDVDVVDDQGVTVDCGGNSNRIEVLEPGQTVTCSATGVAIEGQYMNLGSVTGTPALEDPENPGSFTAIDGADDVTDEDPSHYLGAEPSVDIEKATNGEDADTLFGPIVAPGDVITWTFVVTNDGPIPLADLTVSDDDTTVTVDCGDGTAGIEFLLPGESATCEATGTAGLGTYRNIGDVTGTPVQPTTPTDGCCDPEDPASWPTDPSGYEPTGQDDVTDDDPSHYVANDGDIVIEKSTNDEDADVVPGPIVDIGSEVTWTYTVVNTSETPLMDVTVSDDQGESVDCGFGGSTIPVLMPGETHTCTATGDATEGQYANIGSVVGQPAEEDADNPGTFDPLPGVDPVTDEDPSHYLGADPSIDIEKATNGEDADQPLGPVLEPGSDVTWTYVVTNDGDVPLADAVVVDNDPAVTVVCPSGDNTIALLLPAESVACEATGIAEIGAYSNIGDVTGTPVQLDDPAADPTDPANYSPTGQDDVVDDDPSHYVGADGGVMIEKSTNGQDADTAPGVILDPGAPITWTYTVANTSDTPLIDLRVADDQGVFVDCGNGSNTIALLLPGAVTRCTATGEAVDGDYVNIGSVIGQPATEDPNDPGSYLPIDDADPVGDDDPSNHRGALPSIDIEKATNGDDADDTQGPLLAPGDAVTWTYVVTNDGLVPLLDATVVDSQGETVVCPSGDNTIALLLPGEAVTCEARGTAALGQYENNSTVTGTPAQPTAPTDGCCDPTDPASWPTDPAAFDPTGQDDVTDEDPSHYVAVDPSVRIEKATNGSDADTAPGPIVTPGSDVTWTYLITNDGATALVDLVVSDDQGVSVDCGDGTDIIAELLPGWMHICNGTGEGAEGQYMNLGTVTGTAAVPGPDGELVAVDGPGGEPLEVSDDDPSHHLGLVPSIGIEKDTNGDDADFTSGPLLAIGDAVTWTYVVTNTGEVPLADTTVVDDDPTVAVDCGDGTNVIAGILLPGASATCVATGTAELGEYENISDVTGTPVQPTDPAEDCCDPADPDSWPGTDPADYEPTGQDDVVDDDPSHYTAHDGEIVIQKSTNGFDADTVPGPVIAPGDPVTWRYVVTNVSATPLVNVTVSDDQGEPVDCGDNGSSIPVLLAGETYECTATGIAAEGQYTNLGSVVGIPGQPDPANPGSYLPIPDANPVTDDDPSHYLGATPAIDIEKATNGVDSDTAPGEQILEGDPVEWTYVVTNTGDMTLVNAIVGDDQGVAVDCGDGTNIIALLAVDESVTCVGNGIAGEDDYANIGDVVATPAFEDPNTPGAWLPVPEELADPVSDDDPSHYDGVPLVFDLALVKKLTDGPEGTLAPQSVTFSIEVINQGSVDAIDVMITDHLPANMELSDPDWTDNGDGTASIMIEGPIKVGESYMVEIDVQVMGYGTFENIAGVTEATPTHPETAAVLGLDDVDSVFGDTTDDNVIDDVTDNTSGDEDDSDIAEVRLAQPAATGGTPLTGPDPIPSGFGGTNTGGSPDLPGGPQAFTTNTNPGNNSGPLAYTGANSRMLTLLGLTLVVAGAAFVTASKKRRRDDDGLDLDWQPLDD